MEGSHLKDQLVTDPQPETHGVSRADLQRIHTRVATRLGDVACDDRDTVATEGFFE